MTVKKERIKKIAFVLSLFLCILWGVLGTGASLAWFRDTTPELKNVFHVADFDLQVFYRLPDGSWKELEEDTEIFNKDALYEPGYTEIVYLKVKNNSEVPFMWQTAVRVYKYTEGINYDGDTFNLQDYLRFGLAEGETFEEAYEKVNDRKLTTALAVEPLDNYSTTAAYLDEDDERYIAIVVRMPEEVTNVANYKPPHQPEVYLNVIVSASQIKN